MAEGKCATCSRYLLVIINLIFWLSGIVFLGVGIWLVSSTHATEIIEENMLLSVPSESVDAVAYFTIAAGAFMFFVGFCGCCGAIRESACMLALYIVLMSVLLLGEIASGIYVAVQKHHVEDFVKDQLMDGVNNAEVTNSGMIDSIQTKFTCCGTESFKDYANSEFFMNEGNKLNLYVPDSCCRKDWNTNAPRNQALCQKEARLRITNGTDLHARGCFPVIIDSIEDNSAVLIGVAAAVALIEILCIIFAICLCRHRSYYYYEE